MVTKELSLKERHQVTLIILLSIIIILAVGELIILGLAYLDADVVKCDWLWCEFTTVKRQMSMDCYQNGERINCTGIDVNITIPTAEW